jgi:hypothetical protein
MKVMISPLKSKLMNITSKIHKVSDEERKQNIQKNILDMHQLTCEAITRCVIMGKTDSFECKKFLEFYKKICKIQGDFIKTGRIEPVDFIKTKREVTEYYNLKFKED